MRNLIIVTCAGAVSVGAVAQDLPRAGMPGTQPVRTPRASQPADEQFATEERVREADRHIYEALARQLPAATFAATPLDQVMEWFGENLKVNLHVEWQTMVDAGVRRDVPITLRLSDLPAWRVLRAVLDGASSEVRLEYDVVDGVLLIATEERLTSRLVTRTYPVGDLLVAMARRLQRLEARGNVAEPSAEDLAKAADPTYRERTARRSASEPQPAEIGERFVLAAQQHLANLFETVVAPDTWTVNGGIGTLEFYNNALAVRQSRAVHRQVERVLRDLRASGGTENSSRPSGGGGAAP